MLLWLNGKGISYITVRENSEIIDRLPFSTENKYMVSVVKSVVLNKNVAFVKGAPEILLALSNLDEKQKREYQSLLLDYQNKAMRTLALAYVESNGSEQVLKDGKLNVNDLNFVGIFGIQTLFVRMFPLLSMTV